MAMCYLKSIAFLLCFVKFGKATDVPLVNTTQGLVGGLAGGDGDYYMYLGIPYGLVDPKNPFGPSSPTPEFEGIFNATDDSASCPQRSLVDGNLSGTLDCLHLNVFVPYRSEPGPLLPVLIFIHGGAFVSGSYSRYAYGAKYLVRHDVVLVTFNYRLGPYGYMCTDNARVPGNQAMKDQLLALKWINENIASFGGDPDRVTLSGNSAGGMSIDLIISSDDGPRFFQQAILQSGVAFLPSYPPTARDSPLKLAKHFGVLTDDMDEALNFLATVDPFEIVIASDQLNLEFRPCIENKIEGVESLITENWVSKQIVQARNLKIMIGFNENEALGLFLRPESDLTDVVEQSLESTFVTDHEEFTGHSEVRHFFFGDETIDGTKFKEAIDLMSDNTFVYNSMRSVKRYLKSDVKEVYLYLFLYDGERNILKNDVNTTLEGAAHADEIGYLYDVSYFGEPNSMDQMMINRMTEMWTNFVKYGDPTPNPSTLVPVKWEAITPKSPYHYIHIDSELEVGTHPYNERMAFWDIFLELNGHLQRFILENPN